MICIDSYGWIERRLGGPRLRRTIAYSPASLRRRFFPPWSWSKRNYGRRRASRPPSPRSFTFARLPRSRSTTSWPWKRSTLRSPCAAASRAPSSTPRREGSGPISTRAVPDFGACPVPSSMGVPQNPRVVRPQRGLFERDPGSSAPPTPSRTGRGSADRSPDQHVALPERPNDAEPLPFEHPDGAEPGRHRPAVRGGVRLDDPSTVPPDRLQSGAEGEPRDARPSERAVDEEAGDPPVRGPPETAREGPVLPPSFYSRQVVAPPELAPTHGPAMPVDQDPLPVAPENEGAMVPPVRLLAPGACERTGRSLSVIEHAPASRLHAVILPEQALEIGPAPGRKLARLQRERSSAGRWRPGPAPEMARRR